MINADSLYILRPDGDNTTIGAKYTGGWRDDRQVVSEWVSGCMSGCVSGWVGERESGWEGGWVSG